MGKIITVANQKGGVAKTTTVINLASFLAIKNKKILVVDIDPQANATSGLGIDRDNVPLNVYNVLIDNINLENTIIETAQENLAVVPASIDLAGAELELATNDQREFILKKALAPVKDLYDFILIDCPPSLGLLTINALTAADSVLIPVQCEYYALEGLGQLMNTYNLVKENLNPQLEIEGVLLTMFDARTNLAIQVVDEVKNYFKGYVYASIIPRNVRLSEAPSHGKAVSFYDKRSKGSQMYEALAEEVLEANE